MTPPEEPTVHEVGRRTYLVADVEPLDVGGTRTVAVGTVAWLVAFAVMLPFRARLEEQGREWWMWTCLAGVGLGLFGWEYCRRRAHRMEHPDATEAFPPA